MDPRIAEAALPEQHSSSEIHVGYTVHVASLYMLYAIRPVYKNSVCLLLCFDFWLTAIAELVDLKNGPGELNFTIHLD